MEIHNAANNAAEPMETLVYISICLNFAATTLRARFTSFPQKPHFLLKYSVEL